MKKFFLVLFPLLLAVYGAGMLYQYFSTYDRSYIEVYRITYNTWAAFVFLFLGRLFYTGTFRKTIWVRPAYLGIGCLFMGMLFRLQHWPMGGLICLVGTATVAICYSIHFFRKQSKRVIDIAKLSYVLLLLAVMQLKLMHYPYSVEFSWAMTAACLVLFMLYYIEEWKGEKASEKVIVASEGNDIFQYPDEEKTTS